MREALLAAVTSGTLSDTMPARIAYLERAILHRAKAHVPSG